MMRCPIGLLCLSLWCLLVVAPAWGQIVVGQINPPSGEAEPGQDVVIQVEIASRVGGMLVAKFVRDGTDDVLTQSPPVELPATSITVKAPGSAGTYDIVLEVQGPAGTISQRVENYIVVEGDPFTTRLRQLENQVEQVAAELQVASLTEALRARRDLERLEQTVARLLMDYLSSHAGGGQDDIAQRIRALRERILSLIQRTREAEKDLNKELEEGATHTNPQGKDVPGLDTKVLESDAEIGTLRAEFGKRQGVETKRFDRDEVYVATAYSLVLLLRFKPAERLAEDCKIEYIQCVKRTIKVDGVLDEARSHEFRLDPTLSDDAEKERTDPTYPAQAVDDNGDVVFEDAPGHYSPWKTGATEDNPNGIWVGKHVVLEDTLRIWIICRSRAGTRVLGYVEWGGVIDLNVGANKAETKVNSISFHAGTPKFVPANSENLQGYTRCVDAERFPDYQPSGS